MCSSDLAERAHGSGKDSGNQESAEAGWELVEDVVGENVGITGGEVWIGIVLVVDPKKDPDAQKGEDDGKVRQAGTNEGEAATGRVFGGKHALDHVLIGSVGGHGDKGRGKEGGPDGIFTF